MIGTIKHLRWPMLGSLVLLVGIAEAARELGVEPEAAAEAFASSADPILG